MATFTIFEIILYYFPLLEVNRIPYYRENFNNIKYEQTKLTCCMCDIIQNRLVVIKTIKILTGKNQNEDVLTIHVEGGEWRLLLILLVV